MRYALLACGFALLPGPVWGAGISPADADFFESKVRPVLVDHCQKCHGSTKQMGGLRLDSAAGVQAGADAGPVTERLVPSIRRIGDYPMPPNKPLDPQAVAVLEEWVKRGAGFPEALAVPKPDAAAPSKHWAFQPVADPPVPQVGPPDASPVDRFLLAKLAAKNISFAPPADRRTLLRRVSYDLIGLPPSAAEADAFAVDPDPMAYTKAVDRLLTSPHYGERWGRYWLDLARYADTKGYVFTEDRAYPYAWTYRDYVINSLNADKPYDRFIAEQLAADRLDLKGDPSALAGLGFLTVGRRFSNNPHDIIDDRIDVVTRGLMGLTVQCARCHDHKFDPVPTADYYALYGVFASTTEPKDLPLLAKPAESKGYAEFEVELKKREKEAADFRAALLAKVSAEVKTPAAIAKYLLVAQQSLAKPDNLARRQAREEQLRGATFGKWRARLQELAKAKSPPAEWAAWVVLSADKADIPALITKLPPAVPKPIRDALLAAKPKTLADVAVVYGTLATTPAFKPLAAAGGPLDVTATELDKSLLVQDRDALVNLQRKIDGFKAASPFAPARAMAVADLPTPVEQVVFVRGNPDNRGAKVTRHAPGVIDPSRTAVARGSGRLELAKAITDPQNPLTARVIVNRVWAGHFGRPLVATPSDFGLRSELPSHPELLDHLATQFVRDGWSLKRLHRTLVLTAAYRQSGFNPSVTAADPENVLLGRMTPRRLDFEALRDSLLVAAGRLDERIGGRSVELFAKPFPTRRTVYASIDRQNLPGTLRTFDFASPDGHSPGRFTTTVPQQALFLMNSPFVLEQAHAVARRVEVAWAGAPPAKVRAVTRAVLGRSPTADELVAGVEFLALPTRPGDPPAIELLAQVLMAGNEFAFVD